MKRSPRQAGVPGLLDHVSNVCAQGRQEQLRSVFTATGFRKMGRAFNARGDRGAARAMANLRRQGRPRWLRNADGRRPRS